MAAGSEAQNCTDLCDTVGVKEQQLRPNGKKIEDRLTIASTKKDRIKTRGVSDTVKPETD